MFNITLDEVSIRCRCIVVETGFVNRFIALLDCDNRREELIRETGKIERRENDEYTVAI